MTTRLTPEREREKRERAEKATPGLLPGPSDHELGNVHGVILTCNSVSGAPGQFRLNREFHQSAREDVLDLLAEIDALRRERDEAREQQDRNGALLEIAQETTRIAQRRRERVDILSSLDRNDSCGPSFSAAGGHVSANATITATPNPNAKPYEFKP